MLNATETRRTIRTQFPGLSVGMKEDTFSYLHHDDSAFERRTVPCINVNVTSKEYRLSSLDKRIYLHPEWTEVVDTLRAVGLCAEITTSGVKVMLVNRPEWPRNEALNLGDWHTELTKLA